MDVFISYSTTDRAFSEKLATALRGHGLAVWYDRWEIKVGDSIVGKIADGINAADALVVVLSSTSVQSRWVIEELNAATMRSLADNNILLLPALRERCDIPALLRHRRYADFTQDFSVGILDLIEALLPLQRLWSNLAEIQRQHTGVIAIVAAASDRDDVSEQIKLLYNLMSAAIDVRLEIETRQDLAATSLASSISLFDKITILAERGIDVRSQTWNKLVHFRSAMAHSMSNDYGAAIALAHHFGEGESGKWAGEILRESLGRLSELMAVVANRNPLDADWYRRE